ncbi:MAG: hypothetical protein AUG44_11630 [Actinobacteria bacterium 13_1_20CM_3_71_11]|nr:MAG: hypothetical protein AUG44_11630 [Actinobacteria bacterium 13_1_20CM_3_71_11]
MTTTSTATTNRPQTTTARRHPVAVTRGNTALAPERRPTTNTKTGPALRVAPPAPVSVPRAPFVALVLVVVIAGVLGILVLNTKINENAFTLNHLQDQQNHLDQQEQQLDQHLADLESPNSLRAAALRQGLIDSGTPAYLPLPNGQTVGVPQPAQPSQPGR